MKVPMRPHKEMLDDHKALQSDHETLVTDLAELAASYKNVIADCDELIFNLVATTYDPDIAQRMRVLLEQAGAFFPTQVSSLMWLTGVIQAHSS